LVLFDVVEEPGAAGAGDLPHWLHQVAKGGGLPVGAELETEHEVVGVLGVPVEVVGGDPVRLSAKGVSIEDGLPARVVVDVVVDQQGGHGPPFLPSGPHGIP
jgi:hypothetical protein